ncbi:MAG: hypothetical protein U1E25_09700 [Methylocystis sp.]
MLLDYAWSSVFFTLPNFYTRATQLVLDYETPVWAQEGDRRPIRARRWSGRTRRRPARG